MTNASIEGTATFDTSARRCFVALGYAVLPIAVLVLALRWGAAPLRLMTFDNCRFKCAGRPLERAAPELLWLGGFGLLCVVSLACIVVGTLAVRDYAKGKRIWPGFLVVVLVLAIAAQFQTGPFVQMLTAFETKCFELARHFLLPKRIGEAGAISLGLAMCATSYFVTAPAAHEVAKRIVHLRWMLYLGTALFILALVVIRYAYAYTLQAASCKTRPDSEQIAQIATAGAVYAGMTYSLLLAAFFVPGRVQLHRVATALIPGDKTEEPAKIEWMKERDLSITSSESFWEFASVLGPVLSTVLFEFI